MTAEDEVKAASQHFYAALTSMANGDAGPMAAAWSHGATVTTMRPRGDREVGWDAVQTSFEQVAVLASGGAVHLEDQMIRLADDVAYEVGVEQGQITLAGERIAIEHRVTNVYQREAGRWKIVHHHADLAPAMVELVKRLKVEA